MIKEYLELRTEDLPVWEQDLWSPIDKERGREPLHELHTCSCDGCQYLERLLFIVEDDKDEATSASEPAVPRAPSTQGEVRELAALEIVLMSVMSICAASRDGQGYSLSPGKKRIDTDQPAVPSTREDNEAAPDLVRERNETMDEEPVPEKPWQVPGPSPVRRRWHEIAAYDSLASLAMDLYQDVRVAWLIVSLNRTRLSEVVIDNCTIVEIVQGTVLALPTLSELEDFYATIAGVYCGRALITVVRQKALDRQFVEMTLSRIVLGRGSSMPAENLVVTDQACSRAQADS